MAITHWAIGCVALLVAIPEVEAEDWQVVELVDKDPHPVGASWPTITDHTQLSGQMTSDGGVFLYRLFRNGRLLWEKNAPSPQAFIPASTEMVVFVGQGFAEGAVTDGPNMPERIYAYNARGAEIAFVEASPVLHPHALANGHFFYSTAESLTLVDLTRGGRVVWEIPEAVSIVRVLPGEVYAAAHRAVHKHTGYETLLIDLRSGSVLRTVGDSFDTRPMFIAASSDGDYVFLRLTDGMQPLSCRVEMYRVGEWLEPVMVIQNLNGGPLAADRHANGSVAILYLVVDPNLLPKVNPRIEIRDDSGALVGSYVGEPSMVRFFQSYLQFTGPDSLRFNCERTELHLARGQE